jgi:ribosomal protein S18 acetylase RimI-like enzyme
MIPFTDHHIKIALVEDDVALVNLLNSAYRGEASKKGWTTEAHLIAGDTRTTVEQIQEVLTANDSVMLKYILQNNSIAACVNLQIQGNKIYLGMFSVVPEMQGSGLGKKLLHAAEEFALYKKCTNIYMTVIRARTELIDWYKRYGYKDTGERKPFIEDGISGKHLQKLEFAVLEKKV